ncbi:MAG: hypothetical protein JNM30_14050 [Rhodospirillales bacterium]|nr:hypothetical protein [Rhodospirillales bacterium]
MSDRDDTKGSDDGPLGAAPTAIDPAALNRALCSLTLLGDDPFLRMQAFNLAAVDAFITGLEHQVLAMLITEERTPLPEASFLSAQSQMWIFAAYELMRTWRQRTSDMVKWHESSGLQAKLAALEKKEGYQHFGRQYRAAQVRAVIDNPHLIEKIRLDLKRTRILFIRLEAIRISLAKHEVWKKGKSVALSPGYGRINSWCGALDYELENGQYSMGTINRRDIADEIRALADASAIPSDEDISSFEEYMRGPVERPI